MAPRPISPNGEKLDPAVPPSPVAGAPTGMIVVPEPLDLAAPVDVPGLEVTGFFTGVGCVVVVVGVVVVVVVVVGVAEHVGTEIVLSSSVTAPV
jgi:hypothetical protein